MQHRHRSCPGNQAARELEARDDEALSCNNAPARERLRALLESRGYRCDRRDGGVGASRCRHARGITAPQDELRLPDLSRLRRRPIEQLRDRHTLRIGTLRRLRPRVPHRATLRPRDVSVHAGLHDLRRPLRRPPCGRPELRRVWSRVPGRAALRPRNVPLHAGPHGLRRSLRRPPREHGGLRRVRSRVRRRRDLLQRRLRGPHP